MKSCYLCGSRKNLTRDHVPPKGLFPKPRPSNLPTVPCCATCNNSYSQEDEYFRLAVSSLINVNNVGKSIWREKVLKSTLHGGRIAKHIETLRKNIRPTTVSTPFGVIQGSLLPVDAEMVGSVLIRITKGFLAIVHPEVDRTRLSFEVTHIDQFKLHAIRDSGVSEKFVHYTLGDGVYRHWRGLPAENPSNGVWVHMFYGAAAWVVKHEAPKNP